MNHTLTSLLAVAMLGALTSPASADTDAAKNAHANALLEANASSAAFARICEDEPTSEQLKSTTMMLLVVAGYPAHTIQMGSAKFNDVMRREVAQLRSLSDVDCDTHVSQARERLASTQAIIRNSRRDTPPTQQ
ncbi:MAG: hypothetical protein IT532_15265 [Burkholderiales bacterium]|nr:hypothetical protein [Burkholderiales bacterium]